MLTTSLPGYFVHVNNSLVRPAALFHQLRVNMHDLGVLRVVAHILTKHLKRLIVLLQCHANLDQTNHSLIVVRIAAQRLGQIGLGLKHVKNRKQSDVVFQRIHTQHKLKWEGKTGSYFFLGGRIFAEGLAIQLKHNKTKLVKTTKKGMTERREASLKFIQ